MSFVLQLQSARVLENYNILRFLSLLALCQPISRKDTREHQEQRLCHTHPHPHACLLITAYFIYNKNRKMKEQTGRPWSREQSPFLTSASTCCWVRLWFSLYWLALRTCCSMPSSTASQPSHLQRRQPVLSHRKAWELSSWL